MLFYIFNIIIFYKNNQSVLKKTRKFYKFFSNTKKTIIYDNIILIIIVIFNIIYIIYYIMAEKDNGYARLLVFGLFTIYGILQLVKTIPLLIDFLNYEKELINIKELDTYAIGSVGNSNKYFHTIPKSENDIKSDKNLALVTYSFIIIIIICYFIYLISLGFINKSKNNRTYKFYIQLLLQIFILITLILSMVIHVKIFNKYGNDHKTDRNFIINYHDFKKKRGIETTEKYWIFSNNWVATSNIKLDISL